jgi:hypothetical protein
MPRDQVGALHKTWFFVPPAVERESIGFATINDDRCRCSLAAKAMVSKTMIAGSSPASGASFEQDREMSYVIFAVLSVALIFLGAISIMILLTLERIADDLRLMRDDMARRSESLSAAKRTYDQVMSAGPTIVGTTPYPYPRSK